MANEKISELIPAFTLTGIEEVPIVQGGSTVRTTVQDIINLVGGTSRYGVAQIVSASGSPSTTYNFNTLFPSVTFTNVAVSMQMQIIVSGGFGSNDNGSYFYNVMRNNSPTPFWNYSSSYSSTTGGMVMAPSFMFSGTEASPTLQFYISGGYTVSVIMTIITV